MDKLAPLEKGRLLQRSIVIIRDGRNEADIPPADGVIDLQTVAASIDRRPDGDMTSALLDAADMIRTLKILLDAKTEVLRRE